MILQHWTGRTVGFIALLVVLVALMRSPVAAQYVVTNLVSDQTGQALHVDPQLINAWGIAFSPTGPFWVTDTGTGVATVYGSKGVKQKIVVTIPSVGKNHGTPTGEIYNSTSDFKISQGSNSGPALFIFDTEDGTISGWNPSVNANTAVIAVNNHGADYTGLAIGVNNGANFIYAADHKNNKVDVYDRSFNLVNSFTDPNLPVGAGPFNVQNINGRLFVAFTLSGESGGVVDIFDTTGNLIKTFASHGTLKGPWGLAQAPSNFGPASGAILVGNLDDGRINIFNATTGTYMGQLKDTGGKVISIRGLWGLTFGGGKGINGKKNQLFFASGPSGYKHGLFGVINFQ
jgi:uncharacterized protein (TIGR03118 family)